MIHDLDESLRNLIERDVANGAGIDVDFSAPTKDWVGKVSKPTVNVFLYDIREDLTRREVMFEDVRGEDGKVIERRQPPRQFKYGYLITAWTKRPEDEHRLLSSVLGCFVQHERLPPEVLHGSLEGSERPVITQVAIALDQDRTYSNIWGALGGELKPAINVVCIAPFEISRQLPFGPPVTEAPRISVARPDTDDTEQLRPRGKGAAEAGDEEENEEEAEPAAEDALPDETISAGADTDPGRVFRVRAMPR